jgi:hypothetical protein
MNDDMMPAEPERRRRDRRAAREPAAPARVARGLRSVPRLLASVGLEIVGEIVFAGLIALVSYLVYGEVRWLFVAAVWLAVNGVLLLLALAVWLRGRRRHRRR